MNISKTKYRVLKTMTDDLLKAEEFVNEIGVETRFNVETGGDEFRPIQDILKDIVILVNNNPTIIDDAVEQSFDTIEKIDEFLSKYNLNDIERSR